MLIAICHRCPHRQRGCAGPCLCLKSGKDIIEQAEKGECPDGRFNLSPDELAKLQARQQPTTGPGTELEKMFKLIIDDQNCSTCPLRAAQMNEWGVVGCQEHREEIIGWITAAAHERGWLAIIAAGVNAANHGLPLTIGGMVDEAIRRAEDHRAS